MSINITRDECIEKIVSAIQAAGHDDRIKDYLSYIILAQFNCTKQVNSILQSSNEKDATLDLINTAIEEVFGSDFQFTAHGFKRAISDTYKNKEQTIVKHIQSFNDLLYDNLKISSFITSGTLLGMVREGIFLGHDDDIDLAYVSQYSDQAAILRERDALIDLIAAQENMIVVVVNGVIKVRCYFEEMYFDFDLFTGYVDGDYVNIFLQRPNSIPKDAILPLRSDEFYGEKTNIPQRPEALLEVNYGSGWRTPDRSFRYNLNEHIAYFSFLLPADKKNIQLGEFDG